jgi:hypothetical protein
MKYCDILLYEIILPFSFWKDQSVLKNSKSWKMALFRVFEIVFYVFF